MGNKFLIYISCAQFDAKVEKMWENKGTIKIRERIFRNFSPFLTEFHKDLLFLKQI
jgi:hypothetical protein